MKSRTLRSCIVIILCLCLIPSALAATEEQNTTLVKDASQLKMEALEAELGEEGMQKIAQSLELQASLPNVVKASPYGWIAFAVTKEGSHTTFFTAIDESNLTEKEKENLKAELQDIWDRYPDGFKIEDNEPLEVISGIMEQRFIETEDLKGYSPEELEAMRTVDIPNESPELKTNLFRLHENEDYLALEDSLPDVVTNMPYGGLAFAANVPENQVEVMRYIDNSHIPEGLKENYKTKIQDIWDRYPDKITEDDYLFMNELGLITTSSARDEEGRVAGTIDNNNSIFVDNGSEQKIGSVFTGMMAIAVVFLCFYLVRKWK